jgi:hypothetical protein
MGKCRTITVELPFLNDLINHFMATKQELLDAIANERNQHAAAISAKDAKIAELEAQLAGAVTPSDMDELKKSIEEIVPDAPVEGEGEGETNQPS